MDLWPIPASRLVCLVGVFSFQFGMTKLTLISSPCAKVMSLYMILHVGLVSSGIIAIHTYPIFKLLPLEILSPQQVVNV